MLLYWSLFNSPLLFAAAGRAEGGGRGHGVPTELHINVTTESG